MQVSERQRYLFITLGDIKDNYTWHAVMKNLKIIFFDGSNGWDNDILRWEILDVKSYYFLCSVTSNKYNFPTLGSEGPQWGPFEIICLSLCPSGPPHQFLAIIQAARWIWMNQGYKISNIKKKKPP